MFAGGRGWNLLEDTTQSFGVKYTKCNYDAFDCLVTASSPPAKPLGYYADEIAFTDAPVFMKF